jgi:hypothetical protein
MPFYGLEPFDTAEAEYRWTGLRVPGFYIVTVKGHARKFSFGFKLARDLHWVGGLAIDVMGWTGPLAEPPATVPYTVTDTFNGTYLPEILVIGSNKRELVRVKEVPFTTEEDIMKSFSPSG